jgi:LDH2 family malate/lactate/ureidoglycolate dehydrogenase
MAPWGGREKALGNNPWSIAAPAAEHTPLVLDIANTVVARGKIFLARQRGTEIPADWAIDVSGNPTTDPEQALNGTILPMAGHKGYAISLLMDVLAGVLTGSNFGSAVSSPYFAERRSGCGHLAVVLNIEKFLPLQQFEDRASALIGEMKAVPTIPGVDEVNYPGELEDRSEALARSEGLRLPSQTLADLDGLAEEIGIAPVERQGKRIIEW